MLDREWLEREGYTITDFKCGRVVISSAHTLRMLEADGSHCAGPSGRDYYDEMVEHGETADAISEFHDGLCAACGSTHWQAR